MQYHDYPYPSQRRVTFGRRGMVATSQQLAAQAGLDILKKGGNAVDAAVAAAACLTVVEPCSNGLGGDAFAHVWTKDGLFSLNSTGCCPALLDARTVRDAGYAKMPSTGFFPQTVPGIPGAWAELSRRFGRLPFEELLAPAISYAEDGFAVSPTVAEQWRIAAEKTYTPLRGRPEFQEWYRVFTEDGRAPGAGELWRLPDHAKTLRELAASRCESFYRGALADEIDRYMKEAGGYLRREDLAAFSPEWVEPVTTRYHGYDVWELPPNGQGMIALMALNILSGIDLPSLDDPLCWHRQIEALKLAAVDAYRYVAFPRRTARPGLCRAPPRPYRGAGAAARGGSADRRRHRLSLHRRPRGEYGFVHPVELQRLRLGSRGAGHRHRDPQPRNRLLSRSGKPQLPRPRKEAVPYHHSRFSLEGWTAGGPLRCDGGLHAAAGPPAGAAADDRLRPESAVRPRCAALVLDRRKAGEPRARGASLYCARPCRPGP